MSYSTSSDQSAMMTQSASPGGTVPDLVKIGQIPTNTAIDIETDVLDPVVHTDKFCRFQLQNKGILHSNSKIVLRLAKTTDVGFLPVGVGIYSLIQRCALRVGTKTICEIDDFNHYMGYKSMFMSNEHQKQRETYTTGRRLAHKPYYGPDAGTGGADFLGTPLELEQTAKKIGLDLGLDVARKDDQSIALSDHAFCKTNGSFGPEMALSLQELFPFLTQNQLPLFMMTEPVTIELFFSEAAKDRLCLPSSASASSPSFAIDQAATELIADYQYFPQEMMEQYAQQNANLSFTFSDFRLAKRTIDIPVSNRDVATAVSSGQQIVNVGGAGRLVTKLFTVLSDDNITKNSVLGNYHSMSMTRDFAAGQDANKYNGYLTANVKYNDHFLYPIDVDNSAQQFHYLTQAEGMVPFIAREEYNFEGSSITGGTFEGYEQKDEASGLAGRFFYQAYKLNRNERINSRGLELYNTFDPLRNSKATAVKNTATLRTYLELIRVVQLQNGVTDVFFA